MTPKEEPKKLKPNPWLIDEVGQFKKRFMTPKEKAQKLIYAFEAFTDKDNEFEFAKQCALMAVDEILDLDLGLSNCDENNWHIEKYYQQVKQEIEKL